MQKLDRLFGERWRSGGESDKNADARRKAQQIAEASAVGTPKGLMHAHVRGLRLKSQR
jgi:hypothetical protein